MSVDRYSCQQITPEDEQAVLAALRSPWLTQGPLVEQFERALAEYVGAKHAVAVSSGTAALHLAYLAAAKPRDVVLTSPLSFVASANAVLLAGCEVAFKDVVAATGNIDEAHTVGYDLVSPVHFAGRACALPKFHQDAIEDACHALGAMDFDRCSRVGSCAHSLATVFSFHPVKPITTGEGGAITTNDTSLALDLRSLRAHGRDEKGLMTDLGLNYRMTEVAAALGMSQLRRCWEMQEWRRWLALKYRDGWIGRVVGSGLSPLSAAADLPGFGLPFDTGSWHLFPVRIKGGRRDEVKAKLQARGIGVQVHYSPIIPLQPYYRERFGYQPGCFPEAEAWAAEELSLPLHAGMTEADVATVCGALAEALR